MFFLGMVNQVIIIYVLAAVIPAIALMLYVYNQDSIQKQPIGLLLHLAGGGVLAALVSIVLERIGESILNTRLRTSNPWYVVFLAFLVVGAVEEGMKFFILKKRTWNSPYFNCRFDGIVYAVAVSLGFAAFENIGYVFGYGITVASARALLAIPGHMSFAVFMGYFYGRARKLADRGSYTGSIACQLIGYLSAVFFHGFYDCCSMIATPHSTIVFIIFVVLMYIAAFSTIHHEAASDQYI